MRPACLNYITQDAVYSVLVKDPEISIRGEVSLQGFQFEAELIRPIADRDRAEVRQAGLRADRREFRHGDCNVVSGKLIGPAFDGGKFRVNAGPGVLFGVIGHRKNIPKN